MDEKFNETYFERGVEARVSGYTDYKWKPEYVLPLANWLKARFGNNCVYLDHGCAKGFLVKALRMLDCKAFGYDVSHYAIDNCEVEVKHRVSTNINELPIANVVIMKDVLEHIEEHIIRATLNWYREVSQVDYIVVIVPLGDNDKFRIREYELDVTHVTKKDEVWWINKFNEAGFVCDEFYYSIDGIKDNWTKNFPYGNGIFIFKRKTQ